MVSATNKMVFMREVQIPEHTVEKFSSIVGVEEISVTDLKVDGEAGFAKLLHTCARPVGGII